MTSSRNPSQIGRYARTKGARFEREVAEALRVLFPEAKRGIGQTRCAGEVPDVSGTPLWIEAKFRKKFSILDAMAQAERAAAMNTQTPKHSVVIWRKLRARSLSVACRLELLIQLWTLQPLRLAGGPSTMVHLEFEDWLSLVRRWNESIAQTAGTDDTLLVRETFCLPIPVTPPPAGSGGRLSTDAIPLATSHSENTAAQYRRGIPENPADTRKRLQSR